MCEAPRDVESEPSQHPTSTSGHSLERSPSLRSPSLALGLDSTPIRSTSSHCGIAAPEVSCLPPAQDAAHNIAISSIEFDADAVQAPTGNRAFFYIGKFPQFRGD